MGYGGTTSKVQDKRPVRVLGCVGCIGDVLEDGRWAAIPENLWACRPSAWEACEKAVCDLN